MKVERIDYYCDKCGVGDSKQGNVSYLGWAFLEGHIRGIIGEPPIGIQLCHVCYSRLVLFLEGEE